CARVRGAAAGFFDLW
nr:immunoglobulin heavy chain junction region [Macaca mulatta]MOW80565.1 immunoglobulin heavy chain junction region [Macaca mulatta]MOW84126.1 immunoglobulin heavy chain junction region [Macaca mulatta]